MAAVKKSGATVKTPGATTKKSGLSKPMTLSPELQAVIGAGPMPRTEVTKALWVYIKANNLQDPTNKRNINADAKLKKVFGQDSANMFEMTKLISKHLS